MKVFCFLLCIAFVRANLVQKALDAGMSPLSAEFVELINKSNLTWKAKMNFEGWDGERLMRLIGTGRNCNETSRDDGLPICNHRVYRGVIPRHFDAREAWPYCADIIDHIRHQSSCGSCGAMASASAISDRICIQSRGRQKVQISALDIMTCHNLSRNFFDCSEKQGDEPSDGVYIHEAYRFWKDHGVVSGGDYGDYDTCQPYPLPPTSRRIARSISSSNGTEARQFPNPDCPTCYSCREECVNDENYEKDKYWASEVCRVYPDEEEIQREIWTHGSVTAQIKVHPSFFSYGQGVYQHQPIKKPVSHAIKLIGWGTYYVDGVGIPYWLAANSWGRLWADQGYFKILRGVNNCCIKESVYSGFLPQWRRRQ